MMGTVRKLVSPLSGELVSMSEVPDAVFAEGIMGDGIAILPSAGEVRAPLAGRVEVLFPTGHAVAIRTPEGVEVLVHVGIESVKAVGVFTPAVEVGTEVKAGDLLVTFDLEKLRREAVSPVTPVVITGMPEGAAVEAGASGQTVRAGVDPVITVTL